MALLENKVAIVSGSTSGIGRSIVECFASEGARVVLNSTRSVDEGRRLASELPGAIYVQADISTDLGARRLVQAAIQQWGKVDILVNNAGSAAKIDHRDLANMTDDCWQSNLQVNLMGTWYLSRAAIPTMQAEGHGVIINISSVAAVHPTGGGTCIAYDVSKAAVNHLTILLANAFGQDGICVNALALGPIETPMWPEEEREQILSSLGHRTLLRRAGQPDEVARCCLYLCAAGFITGEVLVIDGGMRYRTPR